MAVTKSEAVRNFLAANTLPDLAGLYNPDMEVQVSVAQGDGEKVQSEFRGRSYAEYTNGREKWKSFRIPLHAGTNPEDNDGPMLYDLARHAEGIGLTGWDWRTKVSKWVGFDFDSISGHAEGHSGALSDEELAQVRRKAMEIPWVTVRKSTSGNGLHLYVFLPDVPTANHTEHAALARAILGQMSAVVGYDFKSKVDACGGILWVWHRKMRGTDGLILIKQGEVLVDIPPDWRTHVEVVAGRRRRTAPQVLPSQDARSERDRIFDDMTGPQVPLDAEHQRLLGFLQENRLGCSWQADKNMLVTHTAALKKAHAALGLKGTYDTVSRGRDPGDINCFAFPIRHGAWVVRRYGHGTNETPNWTRDPSGYQRCFLNRTPAAAGGGAAPRKFFVPLKPQQ